MSAPKLPTATLQRIHTTAVAHAQAEELLLGRSAARLCELERAIGRGDSTPPPLVPSASDRRLVNAVVRPSVAPVLALSPEPEEESVAREGVTVELLAARFLAGATVESIREEIAKLGPGEADRFAALTGVVPKEDWALGDPLSPYRHLRRSRWGEN